MKRGLGVETVPDGVEKEKWKRFSKVVGWI